MVTDINSPNVEILPDDNESGVNQVHTQNIISESRNGTGAKDASTV